jgi:hypothetical protein
MQNPLRSSPSANNESCSKSSNLSPGIFFQFFSEILSNFLAKGSFLHLKKVSKENLKSIFISSPLSASAWHCPYDFTRRPGPPSATASSLHCQLAPLVRAVLPNPTMPCTHAPDAVPPSHPTVRVPTRLRSDQLHLRAHLGCRPMPHLPAGQASRRTESREHLPLDKGNGPERTPSR